MILTRGTAFLLLLHSISAGKPCAAPEDYPEAVVRDKHRNRDNFSHGEEVLYHCPLGYRTTGGSWAVRCNNGQWSPITLQCKRKPCGPAGVIAYGHFKYEGKGVLGDKAFAVCDEGYHVTGGRVRTCTAYGWDGEVPTCEIGAGSDCGAPVEYVNAQLADGARMHGVYFNNDRVKYRCAEGYKQDSGSPTVICDDGQWTPLNLVCQKIQPEVSCPSPSVANGVNSGGDSVAFKANSSVTFVCLNDFRLVGSGQVTCGSDGQWRPQLPRCIPSAEKANANCGAPPRHADMHLGNSHFIQHEYPPGAKVHYVCNLGYRRSDGFISVSQCLNGQWTSIDLKCQRKSCGSAGDILNGKFQYEGSLFGHRAVAVCEEGYQLVGRAYRTCTNSGWDGRIPVCEAVQCSAPSDVIGGVWTGPISGIFEHSSVVTYTCHQGQLIGQKNIFCTINGTWSAPAPQCKDVSCRNPEVTNGMKTSGFGRTYKYKYSVSFKCNQGFVLHGGSTITCGADGEWVPALPTCVPATCQTPEIRNGNVKKDFGRRYTYQDAVSIKCNKDFFISGSNTITCGIDGKWVPSPPTCDPKCPDIKVPHMKLSSKRLRPGTVIKLSCTKGSLKGPETITCNKGMWTPYVPTCIIKNHFR